MKTTNYYNTFIQVADDCPARRGEVPQNKNDTFTIAGLQFNMLYEHPYEFTSDDVVFKVYASKSQLTEAEMDMAREQFFGKGQPCLRSSPLGKRYGWGIHFNSEGKVAIYSSGSPEYTRYSSDTSLKQVKAMRSKRL